MSCQYVHRENPEWKGARADPRCTREQLPAIRIVRDLKRGKNDRKGPRDTEEKAGTGITNEGGERLNSTRSESKLPKASKTM